MDFLEIVKSWSNSINPTPEQKDIADYRSSICNSCEFRKKMIHFYCEKCGCPLEKKIFSPKGPEACPGNKWDK